MFCFVLDKKNFSEKSIMLKIKFESLITFLLKQWRKGKTLIAYKTLYPLRAKQVESWIFH